MQVVSEALTYPSESLRERLRRGAAATEAAIRRGDDVVYQATFFDGRWLGYADFLPRVETPSATCR